MIMRLFSLYESTPAACLPLPQYVEQLTAEQPSAFMSLLLAMTANDPATERAPHLYRVLVSIPRTPTVIPYSVTFTATAMAFA